MIKTVIIDDEQNNLIALRKTLEIFCLEIEIIAEANNVESGIEAINKYQPNLIFLDIEMPDGTGFDLLQAFDKINFQVIFVTAFNQYAIKAFQFSAVDYILKPIVPELLIKAVHKASKQPNQGDLEKLVKNLLDNRDNIASLALPTFDGIQIEKTENILYCESEDNYTKFFLKDGTMVMVSRTLKEYDAVLSDSNFFRIHQSYLINLSEVKKYVKGDGAFVVLSNDKRIDVSRRRKQALIDILTKN